MRDFSEDPRGKKVATEDYRWSKQSTQRAACCQDKVMFMIEFRRNSSLKELNDSKTMTVVTFSKLPWHPRTTANLKATF